MQWEYKRIVVNATATVSSLNNRSGAEPTKKAVESFEGQLDALGQEGWELATALIIDGTQNSQTWHDRCMVEYIFKRPRA